MHELSLCEGIIQILQDQARIQSYQRVKTVWLEIGVLANVDLPSMQFSYDVVSRGTLAENSRLEIVQLPGSALCRDCGTTVSLSERYQPCPACRSYRLQITGGDEMRIKELEVA